MEQALSEGRVLMVALLNPDGTEFCLRPAICVRTFSPTSGNFQVLLDGYNDVGKRYTTRAIEQRDADRGTLWITSATVGHHKAALAGEPVVFWPPRV